METIQCTHPPHYHDAFVATCRLWRISALDYLQHYPKYVLCSLLCACEHCVSWTNFTRLRLVSRLHALRLQALTYIERNNRTGSRPICDYATGTLTSGKGAKPDRVTQLNHGEVLTHASYKTTRTWENFKNRGTKMIFLSDELWLIANNSLSFANRSKS